MWAGGAAGVGLDVSGGLASSGQLFPDFCCPLLPVGGQAWLRTVAGCLPIQASGVSLQGCGSTVFPGHLCVLGDIYTNQAQSRVTEKMPQQPQHQPCRQGTHWAGGGGCGQGWVGISSPWGSWQEGLLFLQSGLEDKSSSGVWVGARERK